MTERIFKSGSLGADSVQAQDGEKRLQITVLKRGGWTTLDAKETEELAEAMIRWVVKHHRQAFADHLALNVLPPLRGD